jgi:hypothetical protein
MRIVFRDGRWIILDGTIRKPSTNGTWRSLSSHMDRFSKKASEPVVIEDKDHLQISSHLLSFEFHL